MSEIYATRYHDISCGHRVVGHESKCRWFHGHNYRITFTIQTMKHTKKLDVVGRVVDFGVIKAVLCQWLEDNWDHRFLMWEDDPYMGDCQDWFPGGGFLPVPFNPTAENMGIYLLEIIGPLLLDDLFLELAVVTVEETRKCSAEVHL